MSTSMVTLTKGYQVTRLVTLLIFDPSRTLVYDAYDTIEVSYMDQSESTRNPPPLSSDVVGDSLMRKHLEALGLVF